MTTRKQKGLSSKLKYHTFTITTYTPDDDSECAKIVLDVHTIVTVINKKTPLTLRNSAKKKIKGKHYDN